MHNVINKIYKLQKYLDTNRFKEESVFLKNIFANSDETQAINDETQLPTPRTRRNFPSELVLRRHSIEPLRYVAGTEALSRGEGDRSTQGNVYEVLFEGERAIAKIIPDTNPEVDIWKRILEIKDSISEKQARHLPKIYKIIEDRFDSIIIMEVLEETSAHIRDILKSRSMGGWVKNPETEEWEQEARGERGFVKDEKYVNEVLIRAFEDAVDILGKELTGLNEDIFRAFASERNSIRVEVERKLLQRETSVENLKEVVENNLSRILKMFGIPANDFVDKISTQVFQNIKKYFDAAPRPIAKYYSTDGIDSTLSVLEGDPAGFGPGTKNRIKKLKEEREKSVYTESPESFFYSENYMPETKSLYSLLQTLKEYGIKWSDVHANNLMERPRTRELVIIDVGLYE
jgi:hypothetical protein